MGAVTGAVIGAVIGAVTGSVMGKVIGKVIGPLTRVSTLLVTGPAASGAAASNWTMRRAHSATIANRNFMAYLVDELRRSQWGGALRNLNIWHWFIHTHYSFIPFSDGILVNGKSTQLLDSIKCIKLSARVAQLFGFYIVIYTACLWFWLIRKHFFLLILNN